MGFVPPELSAVGSKLDVDIRGGVHGCTHLVELLGPVATVAYQTLVARRMKQANDQPDRRPSIIGSCHAYRSDGDVVRQRWPKFYTGSPEAPAG